MANHFSAWQYSRWAYVIARSLRHNYASVSERAAVEATIQYFGNPTTGTRPWLADRLRLKTEPISGGGEPIDAAQSDYDEAKMLMVIAKDLKKIPITDPEASQIDTLIAATGNRRYGAQGNTI